MSPKNLCRHCYVLIVLSIFLVTFAASCKKDDAVAPESSTSASTATASASQSFKASLTTQSAAASQTYVASGVISLSNASGVTISGKSIAGGSAASITLSNCNNITIKNCKLYNSTNVGIYLYNCYNITIEGNFFTHVSTGVNAVQCPKGGIVVNSNQFLNMMGPFPKGQFVQFNNVDGPYNQINSNLCENVMGASNPEDAISIYESNGTAASPITVNGNEIRGGGPSTSGGGIMLGDSGGSYITADGNTLVNPGQYGIAISGGSHNTITNNIVYGASQSFTNIGLYLESIGSTVSSATVSGNRVLFYNAAGTVNGAWLASGISTPTGWSTNNWDADIDASVLPTTLITDH